MKKNQRLNADEKLRLIEPILNRETSLIMLLKHMECTRVRLETKSESTLTQGLQDWQRVKVGNNPPLI